MIPADRGSGRSLRHASLTWKNRCPAPCRPSGRAAVSGALTGHAAAVPAADGVGGRPPRRTAGGPAGPAVAVLRPGRGDTPTGRPCLAARGPAPGRTGMGSAGRSVRAGPPRGRPRGPAGYAGAGGRPGPGRLRGSGGRTRGGLRRRVRERGAAAALHVRTGAGAGLRRRRGGRRAGGGGGRAGAVPLRLRLPALGAAAWGRLSGSADAAASVTAATGTLPAAAGVRCAAPGGGRGAGSAPYAAQDHGHGRVRHDARLLGRAQLDPAYRGVHGTLQEHGSEPRLGVAQVGEGLDDHGD